VWQVEGARRRGAQGAFHKSLGREGHWSATSCLVPGFLSLAPNYVTVKPRYIGFAAKGLSFSWRNISVVFRTTFSFPDCWEKKDKTSESHSGGPPEYSVFGGRYTVLCNIKPVEILNHFASVQHV